MLLNQMVIDVDHDLRNLETKGLDNFSIFRVC